MTVVAVGPGGDAAADAHAVGVDVALACHDAVVHRVGGIDLPSEQLAVEVLQYLSVLPDDLEVDDRLPHGAPLLTVDCRCAPSLSARRRAVNPDADPSSRCMDARRPGRVDPPRDRPFRTTARARPRAACLRPAPPAARADRRCGAPTAEARWEEEPRRQQRPATPQLSGQELRRVGDAAVEVGERSGDHARGDAAVQGRPVTGDTRTLSSAPMAAAVKTTVTELPESRVRVEAEVPPAEVQKSVERAARALGRDLRMPGFRKGKVPPPVVIQRFGRDTVLDEAVRGTLSQWYLDAIDAAGIHPVGEPEVKLGDLPGQGQPLTFTVEIGVRPTAKLGEYKGVEAVRREPEVSDEAIQTELDQLRERMARLETVDEPAAEGDFVVMDFAGSIDGEPFAGGE